MTPDHLTVEQRAEAERIHAAMMEAASADLRQLAELLAAADEGAILGPTEFTVRDIVLRVGAKAIEATLRGREKKVTTAPPGPAPSAGRPPSSSAGGPAGS